MTRTSELVAIGTRDIAPPEGRVTLELRSAATGRLRKRVVVENAIMDWYKAAVFRNSGRGGFDVQSPSTASWSGGVNPLQYAQNTSTVAAPPDGLIALNDPLRWPSTYGVARNLTNWLWATAANVTPDVTKMQIPTVSGPEVTAGAKLNISGYAADGIQNKRGALNTALSGRSAWNQIRMVVDFSTSEGNGTYRSVGIGSLINQTIAPGGLRSFPGTIRFDSTNTQNTQLTANGNALTNQPNVIKMVLGADDDMWVLTSAYTLSHWDFTQRGSTWHGTMPGVLEYTISAGNLPGSGGPLGPVLAATPTDFWVARNQTLYRCVTPTSNVAMTVTNTYGLAGTLGAEAILDMCFDGTDLYLLTLTKVYVVNPATGASTSNWTHGLTSGTLGWQSIGWDAAEQVLWINFVDRSATGVAQWGQASGVNIPINQDSCICYGFTTAGSLTKWNMGRPAGNSSTATPGRQINLNSPDGRFLARIGDNAGTPGSQELYGPSMATHALLGSDVVKTSDDTLRITYEFNFA